MMIEFKDDRGNEIQMTVHVVGWNAPRGATPEDMARAYHAMTDEQALEMGNAYAKLPKDKKKLARSFDGSLVDRINELERDFENWKFFYSCGAAEVRRMLEERDVKLTRLRAAAKAQLKWSRSEYQSNGRLDAELEAALKDTE